jgi:hypothetical protein
VRLDWNWPTRQRISLSPQVDETTKKGWISIAYLAPEMTKPKAPGL